MRVRASARTALRQREARVLAGRGRSRTAVATSLLPRPFREMQRSHAHPRDNRVRKVESVMHRHLLLASLLLTLLPLVGCGTDAGSGSSVRPNFVCVYSLAKCFPTLCDGCTLGGYGKCPPTDDAYEEFCSEDPTEATCRERSLGPAQVSASSDQLRYTRDVRLLQGVASCAKFRSDGEASASSIERVCSGVCP